MEAQQRMVGGITAPRKADDEVQEYIEQVKPQVEKAVGRSLDIYIATMYSTQLVNGTNYFVKVDVGGGKFIHVHLHKSFQGEVTFLRCQDDKTKDDKLTYF